MPATLSRSASVAFSHTPDATTGGSLLPPAPKAARTQSRNRQPVFGEQPGGPVANRCVCPTTGKQRSTCSCYAHAKCGASMSYFDMVSLSRATTVCVFCGLVCNGGCEAKQAEAQLLEITPSSAKSAAAGTPSAEALTTPAGFLVDVNNDYDGESCATFYVEAPTPSAAALRVREVCFLDYGMSGATPCRLKHVSFQILCQTTLCDPNITKRRYPNKSGHAHAIVCIRNSHVSAQPCTKETFFEFLSSFPEPDSDSDSD